MRLSLAVLTKKAIEASLQLNWKQAIELNSEILKDYPNNLDAKIRLGRAYLQNKDFTKAKKIFKDVLKIDPINALATKNLELVKAEKTEFNGITHFNAKALLKEPGTTQEAKITIKGRGIKLEDFISGEELTIKVKKKAIEIFKNKKDRKVFVGSVEDSYVVQKANSVLDKGEKLHITYVRGKDNEIWIHIKASIPVFKPDKIEIRPYLKRGTIEEPEIEIEVGEEVE